MYTPIHHTNTHIRVKRKIIEESKKNERKREIHSTHPLVIFDPSFDSVSKPILKSRRQKFLAQAFSLYWWCRQKIKISVTKNSKSQKQLTFGIGLAIECIIQGHAHAREPQGLNFSKGTVLTRLSHLSQCNSTGIMSNLMTDTKSLKKSVGLTENNRERNQVENMSLFPLSLWD